MPRWILLFACAPLLAQDLPVQETLRALQSFTEAHRKAETGRCGEALPRLRGIVAASPGFAEAWLAVGLCEGQAGDAGRKGMALERAVRAKPSFAQARYALGLHYVLTRRRELALEQVRALRSLDPALARELYRMTFAILHDESARTR